MLKVVLEGHDNFYGLQDVLRLFYGQTSEDRGNNLIICENGPDTTIISRADPDSDLPVNRQVKRDLYTQISELEGRTFPWGSLTGIRPTIVAREEDYDYRKLVSRYLVREDKAKLACDTARLETQIAAQAARKLNVYAGVPFCPGRCEYCSFIAEDVTKHLNRLPDYAAAMINEMNELKPFIKETPGTIYMGGGTPTVFDEGDFERVVTALGDVFKADKDTEFTVEAGRPDTISEGKLKAMRKAGVNRICINPQTMRDETLQRLRRAHTAKDVIRAYEQAREAGFEVINMDLIAGLKYETADDFMSSVRSLLELGPENITIHTLYKKRRAGMSRDDVLNSDGRGDIDRAVSEAYEMLRKCGYAPYYMYRQKDTELSLENTGFFKGDTYNIYNVAMMSSDCSVLSVGAGAMSKRAFCGGRFERCANVKDVSLYMNCSKEMAMRKISFFDLDPHRHDR
jgi:Coproporphyrinogen III oxidase and related Fe-S oxidoreductases